MFFGSTAAIFQRYISAAFLEVHRHNCFSFFGDALARLLLRTDEKAREVARVDETERKP